MAGEWWPFDRSWADEWKRNWTEILNVTSAASASMGLPLPKTLPGDPFAAIVEAARAWLIGKKRTFRFSGHDLTLVVDDISIQGVDLARVMGQYGRVRIAARDVRWDGYELERVEIQARNVHLRPGVRPTLVTAPVLFEAFVSAAAAARRLAAVSGLLELVLLDGVPQVGLVGAPWVRLEVQPGAEGRSVLVRPRALRVGEWRLPLPSPAFYLAVPDLPGDVLLTSVESAPGGFVVRGTIGEWRRPLSRDDIERLLAGMRAGQDHLDL
jgi:LmeA-like phospholipid-binding